MIVSIGKLKKDHLKGRVAIVTGAGRGIGYETARSLAWLGANIVIAEINQKTGQNAQRNIQNEFINNEIEFIQTDVGNEGSIKNLKKLAIKKFSRVDIVINNATITPIGSVIDVDISKWDKSYHVNLRGPVLLAKAFLPDMVSRSSGVFINVSSIGQAYMGAYETFKAAQGQLTDTLYAEMAESGVSVFSIAPGLVRTPGSIVSIKKLAPLYGKTEDEFFQMSEDNLISCQEAGAGFAAAVVFAEKYNGQEIGCIQALNDAEIKINNFIKRKRISLSDDDLAELRRRVASATETFREQSNGWNRRPFFERQWIQRDFRKYVGLTAEQLNEVLIKFQTKILDESVKINSLSIPPFQKLSDYYKHMQELAKGYEKDQQKLEEDLKIMHEWRRNIKDIIEILNQ